MIGFIYFFAYLNLMSGRAFSDDNLASLTHYGHSIRVKKLSVAFAALAELEFEAAIAVEYLYAMRIRVCDDDVVLAVDGDTARLGELSVVDAELAELAVVDHFGSLE